MKKPTITKRDVKFYLLGIATIFALEVAFDWVNLKAAISNGFEQGTKDAQKSTEGMRLK